MMITIITIIVLAIMTVIMIIGNNVERAGKTSESNRHTVHVVVPCLQKAALLGVDFILRRLLGISGLG